MLKTDLLIIKYVWKTQISCTLQSTKHDIHWMTDSILYRQKTRERTIPPKMPAGIASFGFSPSLLMINNMK